MVTRRGEIYFDNLPGKEEPLGKAFVCYSREDSQDVKNIIEQSFIFQNIPYSIDKKDIVGGTKFLDVLEKELECVSCGIVVLSPHSIESKWVWFEVGVLIGKGKPIIPFLIKADDRDTFIRDLPDFIRRYQMFWDIDELIKSIQNYIFQFGNLCSDTQINRVIISQLKQTKVTITLSMPKYLMNILKFGYLLIRFGREDILEHPANATLREQGTVINKAIYARESVYDEREERLKVEYLVPVHKMLGVKFKPFVDVNNLLKIDEVVSKLKEAEFLDVKQSDSAEKQRIYFLLPLDEKRCIVKSPDGILDNYLYPI